MLSVWSRRLVPLVLALGLTHCGGTEPDSQPPAPETASSEAEMRSSCPRARLVEDINEGLEPSSIANLTDEDRRRIEAMTESLVNRLLHDPMARLREDGNERHVEALRELFGLDEAPDP